MRLVLVHNTGQACTTLRNLSTSEIAVIERHARTGVSERDMPAWMTELAQAGVWIACDCRGGKELPPLLFVRRVSRSEHVLMPMLDRPPHAADCPLSAAFASRMTKLPATHSDLRMFLYRWLAAARLNLRFPYDLHNSVGVQYGALRDVSRSLPWAGRQSLYEFSRTHPQGLSHLFRALCRSNQVHRRGLYLSLASSAKPAMLRKLLQPDALCKEWLGAVELPVADRPVDADVTGPFIALFELEGSESGVLRIERVMLQPVHSEQVLMPVEAERERRTLDLLLQAQDDLLDTHRQIVTIRKTLGDSLICERGIGFQLEPIGPNGRALHTIDVVSVEASVAQAWRGQMEVQTEPLYHVVDVPPRSRSAADLRFEREEGGVPIRRRSAADRSFERQLLTALCQPFDSRSGRGAAETFDA